jgi:glutathione synthase/RimK-type ligase-like ATP-grasp enzyme
LETVTGHLSSPDEQGQKQAWASALTVVESRLSVEPQNIDAAFNRAQLLWKLGRVTEARQAFVYILSFSPTHFGAINNLGVLLYAAGMKKDARTCYAEAVARHPDNHVGLINLANSLIEDNEFQLAREHFMKALNISPGLQEAHKGLAKLYEKIGDENTAEYHRIHCFKKNSVTAIPYQGNEKPMHALVMASTRGNLPIRVHDLFDRNTYHTTVIIPEFYKTDKMLPKHDIIVNLIGNADICKDSLGSAEKLIAASSMPVINHPAAVLATGRVSIANRLRHIPDVQTPLTLDIPREHLSASDPRHVLKERGFEFPYLLRSPGFSNGLHFYKVSNPQELHEALKVLPGESVTAIQFMDSRSGDGKIRKYRVMMIHGELYPLHAAISHNWKIHFETAEMAESPEHRAEDENFLHNMHSVLGHKAMAALRKIVDMLGLDYGGVDFGLDKQGHILLFEANATMVVSMPDHDNRWDYRREPIKRVMNAIKNLPSDKIAKFNAINNNII